MGITYVIDVNARVVHIRLSDVVKFADVVDSRQRLMVEAALTPHFLDY